MKFLIVQAYPLKTGYEEEVEVIKFYEDKTKCL